MPKAHAKGRVRSLIGASEEKFRLVLEALEQRVRDAEALRKRG